MSVDIHDVITSATFYDDRLRGSGVARGRISRFPIDLRRRPYNTLALPCECVINTSLGGLTLDPARIHCPAGDDAFVSSLFFCHAPSPERRALPFICRFRRDLQRFFRTELHFETRYIVLTFVASWRHNLREIEVKNCGNPKKSEEKFVRSNSYR